MADNEAVRAGARAGADDVDGVQPLSGRPPPDGDAQKRQRVNYRSYGVNGITPWDTDPQWSVGGAQGAAGGRPPQQVGQPQKGAPQQGADRQPPKPRECRLCHKTFPSGAKLFEHLPECRKQHTKKGVVVGSPERDVSPEATCKQSTLATEVAKARERDIDGGPKGPAMNLEVDMPGPWSSGPALFEYEEFDIEWLPCPSRAAAWGTFNPVVTRVGSSERYFLGLRVGDEVRQLERVRGEIDGEGNVVVDEDGGVARGIAGWQFLANMSLDGGRGDDLEEGAKDFRSVLDDMRGDVVDSGKGRPGVHSWSIRVRRHAAVRPVPTLVEWPDDAEEAPPWGCVSESSAHVWAKLQERITEEGGLGDFCHCPTCTSVRLLRSVRANPTIRAAGHEDAPWPARALISWPTSRRPSHAQILLSSAHTPPQPTGTTRPATGRHSQADGPYPGRRATPQRHAQLAPLRGPIALARTSAGCLASTTAGRP